MKMSLGIPSIIRDLNNEICAILGINCGTFMNVTITNVHGSSNDPQTGSYDIHYPGGVHISGKVETGRTEHFGQWLRVKTLKLRIPRRGIYLKNRIDIPKLESLAGSPLETQELGSLYNEPNKPFMLLLNDQQVINIMQQRQLLQK